jgi:hypothetical protein
MDRTKVGVAASSKIGVVVISYNADPEPLFNSMLPSKHDVRSYVFLHDHESGLKAKLEAITASINSRYFPYGKNRGVSRSWNEGLRASFDDGNEATLLINDDLFFYDGGFDEFADFVLSDGILARFLPSDWTPAPLAR